MSSDQEVETLEQRLIAGYSRSSDLLSKARDLSEEAEDLPIEHKQRLPKFTGQWTEDNVEAHVNELERIIREPQVAQSEDRLKEIGIAEEKLETIKRDILQQYSEIDTLVSEYEHLHEEFGSFIEFLVDDEILINQLRENGPTQARHEIEIDNKAKYQNLIDLDNLPRDLKESFFCEVFLGDRSVDEIENLNGWIDTLEGYGVQVEFGEEISQVIQNCEAAVNRAQTLRNEYGYSGEKIRNWISGMSVAEARDELNTKIDHAEQERNRLQDELKEYCELMGKEIPEIDEIPQLEEEVSDLYEELLDKIGVTGEQLLDYLRGRSNELPEVEEQEELLDALEQIRPLFQRRLEGE
jgi:vacuolar-type H+-ATPase subunit I/STV1